jgi:hypothetical protein
LPALCTGEQVARYASLGERPQQLAKMFESTHVFEPIELDHPVFAILCVIHAVSAHPLFC